jgi:hypothetical protein
MGLKSGPNGTKALLVEKYPSCFRRLPNLQTARDSILGEGGMVPNGKKCVLLVDANVLLMAVPDSCYTLKGYVSVVLGYVRDALRASRLVILTFDEPQAMTNAKKEEQARRDAARKPRVVVSSADIAPAAVISPDFSTSDLETAETVFPFRDDRRCRSRFYDEVVRLVVSEVEVLMEKWRHNGHDSGVLLLDGVDLRGAGRAPTEQRRPIMTGTNAAVAAKFAREESIGEGDIKLLMLEKRIRSLVAEDSEFVTIEIVVTQTVDTDSLPIMLLDAAERRVTPSSSSVHSLLAFRETSSKRNAGETTGSGFLCVDVVRLEACIQDSIWNGHAVHPSAAQALNAMRALSAGLALSGCDFVELKGARADHIMNSISDFARTEPVALSTFGSIGNADPAQTLKATAGLRRLCICASANMENLGGRYKKQTEAVRNVGDGELVRGVWTTAYWSGTEHVADVRFGFGFCAQQI